MNTKQKVIVIGIAVLVSYGLGRWSSPTKVKTIIQTVQVQNKLNDTKSNLDLNRHKETVTTTVRKPDGTMEITTHTVEDTTANKTRTQHDTDQLTQTSSQSKEVTYSKSKVTISALGGLSFSGTPIPVYGASVSKDVFGPIAVGAFGLSNRTVGVSVGLTF